MLNSTKQTHKRFKILIAGFAVLALLLFLTIANWTRIQLGYKGYPAQERKILLSLSDDEIKEYLDYDKVIDLSKWNAFPNEKHYLDYDLLVSSNKNTEEIISYVDTFYKKDYKDLSALGYQKENLRFLMQKLSLSEFQIVIQNKLTWEQINPYFAVQGYIVKDFPAYIKSKKSPKDAVMQISYRMIDTRNKADRKYAIKDPSHITTLIKKGFYIPESYVPENLVEVNIPNTPDNTNNQMRKDAANALENMYKDAQKQGLHLVINSAYRSYEEQKKIYDEYFRIYDSVTASKLVAIPGCSEHQLGLSVDLTSQNVLDGTYSLFGNTPEYQWVINHAHEYGFILRYPKDKTNITGTANAPWHFRYVGKKAAREMYEKNLTLEEYTLKHGFSYPVTLLE